MLSLRGILGQIEECDVERTLHKSIRMRERESVSLIVCVCVCLCAFVCVCCYLELLFNVEFDLFPG